MKKSVFCAAVVLLLVTACASSQKSDTPTVRIIAGNIGGVVIQYQGPQIMLREADILARTHCERYGRPALLLNELPGTEGTIAYYNCQN